MDGAKSMLMLIAPPESHGGTILPHPPHKRSMSGAPSLQDGGHTRPPQAGVDSQGAGRWLVTGGPHAPGPNYQGQELERHPKPSPTGGLQELGIVVYPSLAMQHLGRTRSNLPGDLNVANHGISGGAKNRSGLYSVPSGCRTGGSSRTSLPSFRHWTAIFVATELWRWTRESWAMGHACRMWHTVSSASQPPLHLLSSTGFDGMPTVGRFAVRRCTARTQSPPDPKGVGG
jgi:hypothetical protein